MSLQLFILSLSFSMLHLSTSQDLSIHTTFSCFCICFLVVSFCELFGVVLLELQLVINNKVISNSI